MVQLVVRPEVGNAQCSPDWTKRFGRYGVSDITSDTISPSLSRQNHASACAIILNGRFGFCKRTSMNTSWVVPQPWSTVQFSVSPFRDGNVEWRERNCNCIHSGAIVQGWSASEVLDKKSRLEPYGWSARYGPVIRRSFEPETISINPHPRRSLLALCDIGLPFRLSRECIRCPSLRKCSFCECLHTRGLSSGAIRLSLCGIGDRLGSVRLFPGRDRKGMGITTAVSNLIQRQPSVIGVQAKNDEGNDLYPDTRVSQQHPNIVSVQAILKVTKEVVLMVTGIFFVVIGWVLLRGVLPDQSTALGAIGVGLLGLLLLFCAQWLIGKCLDLSYEPSAPAHSGCRPVARVSLLFSLDGQVLPLEPSGVSSCHS